jgi:2-polyprenyl-3-methyl-5-hydroxy-6-metoxy-1,4-benzoquinol methylase
MNADLPGESYTEDYYRLHRRRYLLNDTMSQKRIVDVLSSLQPRPQENLLDVGCGIGVISLESYKRGASVTGVDYSENAVKIARKLAMTVLGENKIEYLCLGIQDIPVLRQRFDKVSCADFVEHISRELFEAFLKSVKQVMNPGGRIVIYTPNGMVPEPTLLQKLIRLIGLLPPLRYDDIAAMGKSTLSQRWYPLGQSEDVPDQEFEYLHVDVKPAGYLIETLRKHGFRASKIIATRSSSRFQKLPYPFNILWGGHICITAQKIN